MDSAWTLRRNSHKVTEMEKKILVAISERKTKTLTVILEMLGNVSWKMEGRGVGGQDLVAGRSR